MTNNTDKLIGISLKENICLSFSSIKIRDHLFMFCTHTIYAYTFINNINTNTKSYNVWYYTVYILFLYDSNELHLGYLTYCYEDKEVLYTWDGNVEIFYRGVGRDSPAARRMYRFFVRGMGV